MTSAEHVHEDDCVHCKKTIRRDDTAPEDEQAWRDDWDDMDCAGSPDGMHAPAEELGATEAQGLSLDQIAAILDSWYERYSRAGRMGERNEDMFLALRNRLIPLVPDERVQFRDYSPIGPRCRAGNRWLNGTYDGPVANPDDPNREGDVWVIRDGSSHPKRVQVFLSSVRRRS